VNIIEGRREAYRPRWLQCNEAPITSQWQKYKCIRENDCTSYWKIYKQAYSSPGRPLYIVILFGTIAVWTLFY